MAAAFLVAALAWELTALAVIAGLPVIALALALRVAVPHLPRIQLPRLPRPRIPRFEVAPLFPARRPMLARRP